MPEKSNAEKLDELAHLDSEGRVGRTAMQVGVPASLVVIAHWAARLAGIDLDPNAAGVDMPAEVVAAWIAVVTVVLARWMNRPANPQGDT